MDVGIAVDGHIANDAPVAGLRLKIGHILKGETYLGRQVSPIQDNQNTKNSTHILLKR
jgi:hypothetical protein